MATIRKKRNFKGLQLGDSPSAGLSSTIAAAEGVGNGVPSSSSSGSSSSLAGGSSSSSTTMGDAGNSGSSSSSSALRTPRSSVASSSLLRGNLTATNTSTLDPSSTIGSSRSRGFSSAEVEPSSGASYHNTLTEQLKNLELGVEYKLDLKNEDLQALSELGSGNGGTVTKVLHEKSGRIMAKKTVFIDAKPSVRKQILRELQILHECDSKYIVSFYGAYMSEPHICMCMEFMDKSSLDTIWKKWGPIPPEICGQVAVVVVEGLTYLYEVHRIIHRDVKPSNILVNSAGQIKLCDFGVSGELENSVAETFVGTSTYMSPERIQGDQYSVKSDVWSLGVSIIELALGRFPFADDDDEDDGDEEEEEELRGTLNARLASSASPNGHGRRPSRSKNHNAGASQMSMLELLQRIVNEPPPKLYSSATSSPNPGGVLCPEDLCRFVDECLTKDPMKRPTPKELTKHPYIIKCETGAEGVNVNVKKWVDGLI